PGRGARSWRRSGPPCCNAVATTARRWRAWICRGRAAWANGCRPGCCGSRWRAPRGRRRERNAAVRRHASPDRPRAYHRAMTRKADQLTESLRTLDPVHLDVADESHMHSRGLETHYKAVIVGEVFAGKRAVQ